MRHHTEAFNGIDTSKLRNVVSIAKGGVGARCGTWESSPQRKRARACSSYFVQKRKIKAIGANEAADGLEVSYWLPPSLSALAPRNELE